MAVVEIQLPELWENQNAKADQKRFILSPKRISAAATASKTGKTMGCAIWVVMMVSKLPPGSLIWWVGPYWRTVNIGWERVKQLIPESKRKTNESDKVIVTSNGVRIEFRSAENPDTLYGEAVHAMVIDEGPRMRRSAWVALQTTMMQTRGPIRMTGNTDKGKNNWFYEVWLRGQKGDPDVDSWSMKTYDNPHMDKEFVLAQRASHTDRSWAALVEGEFTDDGSAVFRGIEECLVQVKPRPRENTLALPYQITHSYALGLDLGKYTDFTVVTGLDLTTRWVSYWDRFNQRSWPLQMRSARDTSVRYGNAPIWMDSTGAGEPILEQLQTDGAPVNGYKFNNKSKVALIEKLIMGIERRDILIPEHLLILREELGAYEVELTESGQVIYSSPGEGRGVHDDSVISLALAYWSAPTAFEVGYQSAEKRSRRDEFDEEPDPSIRDLDVRWRDGRGGGNPMHSSSFGPKSQRPAGGRFGDYRGGRWR